LGAQAAAEGISGVIFTLLIFFGVFWISWLVMFIFVNLSMKAATWAALSVMVVFAAVSVWTAWKKIDPLAGMRPYDAADAAADAATMVTSLTLGPVMFRFNRFSSAGFALLLISGPSNLLEALATWRGRIPEGDIEDVSRRAASLLMACGEEGIESTAIDAQDTSAVVLLRTLGLAKLRQPDMRTRILWLKTTQKGRDLLGTGGGAFRV